MVSNPGQDAADGGLRIEIVTDIPVTCRHMWHCLTDAAALRTWFGPHLQLDARLGGRFREVWWDGVREVVTEGHVTSFEPVRRLALSWKDRDWPAETEVVFSVSLCPIGARLMLVHRGWERLGPAFEEIADAHRRGWEAHLASLVVYARRSRNPDKTEG